ncbi:Rap1a/Tai family immunity protein [Burkholderia cepacia]|uniref:Rap1a/Tai family immunity protein n=1 Tax=Burkholderia cepacia TaxID=292 RepID=UPI0026569188|nr:Rap1a/Tai family immunity protein [Burkholderia cepacia]MDN7855262.1 Rap1a/Tai family immunity protein [Burkholderia cepacia]
MKRFLVQNLLVVASLSASIGSATGAAVPRVDGTRLLDGVSRSDNRPYADAERHAMAGYLAGYLAGVADATEGKAWCDNGRVKPGEIDSEVLAALRQLPRDALKASAARLVAHALRQKFSCR